MNIFSELKIADFPKLCGASLTTGIVTLFLRLIRQSLCQLCIEQLQTNLQKINDTLILLGKGLVKERRAFSINSCPFTNWIIIY